MPACLADHDPRRPRRLIRVKRRRLPTTTRRSRPPTSQSHRSSQCSKSCGPALPGSAPTPSGHRRNWPACRSSVPNITLHREPSPDPDHAGPPPQRRPVRQQEERAESVEAVAPNHSRRPSFPAQPSRNVSPLSASHQSQKIRTFEQSATHAPFINTATTQRDAAMDTISGGPSFAAIRRPRREAAIVRQRSAGARSLLSGSRARQRPRASASLVACAPAPLGRDRRRSRASPIASSSHRSWRGKRRRTVPRGPSM